MTQQPPGEAVTTFANNVRAEMVRRRRTYAELAGALGVTKRTVQARMTGYRPWTLDEAVAVARWLDVPLAELLTPPPGEIPPPQDGPDLLEELSKLDPVPR